MKRRTFGIWLVILLPLWVSPANAQFTIAYPTEKETVQFGVSQLVNYLNLKGEEVSVLPISGIREAPRVAVVMEGWEPDWLKGQIGFDEIENEGFSYRWFDPRNSLLILAKDEVGAQYGILGLMEFLQGGNSFTDLEEKTVNPTLEYRIIKFNLPWSPYRDSEATAVHLETCRDLAFWERFLDMMVENRFNVLSLWNNHPFPFMIRAENFPEATPFDDREMEDWKGFWNDLLKMAKIRGIQTFIVNWNIVVSPEFVKAYGGSEYNDLSDKVKTYTKESVTQLINEYPDLTGIGVTLADWMGTFDEKMTPEEREAWIEETFVAGMKAADRPVKFLHRSVLAGDPMAMRGVLDRAELEEPALVEIKFNWSHGHSTPKLAITHDYHSGELDDRFWNPMPENYRIQWMVRNEDFFILRWGQPDFIREHIRLNRHPYVNGYFVGSEGYIPAMDYSHVPSPVKTWQYAFEKQWLFYKVWGRLLYREDTPDNYFESAFEKKYGKEMGRPMLEAFKLASDMPLKLASFYRSTWDYTLYAEGFISAEPSSRDGFFDRSSPFISIEEFIHHETLDPDLVSIGEFVGNYDQSASLPAGKISPLQLADSLESDSKATLALLKGLRNKVTPYSGALQSELDDLETWANLAAYMADKVRAGVSLQRYIQSGDTENKSSAVDYLERCLDHWKAVIDLTKDRYMPVPHVSTEHYDDRFAQFSWEHFLPQVERDIELAEKTIPVK